LLPVHSFVGIAPNLLLQELRPGSHVIVLPEVDLNLKGLGTNCTPVVFEGRNGVEDP